MALATKWICTATHTHTHTWKFESSTLQLSNCFSCHQCHVNQTMAPFVTLEVTQDILSRKWTIGYRHHLVSCLARMISSKVISSQSIFICKWSSSSSSWNVRTHLVDQILIQLIGCEPRARLMPCLSLSFVLLIRLVNNNKSSQSNRASANYSSRCARLSNLAKITPSIENRKRTYAYRLRTDRWQASACLFFGLFAFSLP